MNLLSLHIVYKSWRSNYPLTVLYRLFLLLCNILFFLSHHAINYITVQYSFFYCFVSTIYCIVSIVSGIPAVIVGVSLGVSRLEGYGNKDL